MSDIDLAKIKKMMEKVAPRWWDVVENNGSPPQEEGVTEFTEFVAFVILKRLVEEISKSEFSATDEVETAISFKLKNLGQERVKGLCTGSGWPDRFFVIFDNS